MIFAYIVGAVVMLAALPSAIAVILALADVIAAAILYCVAVAFEIVAFPFKCAYGMWINRGAVARLFATWFIFIGAWTLIMVVFRIPF